MSKFNIIKESLKKEGIIYIKMLKDELEFQKHMASGRLAKSFYTTINETTNTIVLSVMNDTPYMWLVNDGNSGGVSASFQAISDWALDKQDRGEISFSSEHALNRFVQKVKHNLEKKYLTRGGEMVAPRRYFFIDIVIEKIKKERLKKLEDDINNQIIDFLELKKKEKVVKINIA
jgi:hypothetical protein